MSPFLFLVYGLTVVVILGVLGVVAIGIVILWLWLISPPRKR